MALAANFELLEKNNSIRVKEKAVKISASLDGPRGKD